MKVYTVGYAHWTANALQKRVQELNALLLDIRYAPRSRRSEWSGEALTERFGDGYVPFRYWGNENYNNGGPIKISPRRFQDGLIILRALPDRPVVLMCGCADYRTCHRRVVAERLQAEGYEVEELTPPTKAGAIKALTLYQPWATLVAIGAKRIETRSWWTAYRGLLAIHASKTFGATNRALCHQEPFRSALLAGGVERLSDLPLGAVVAVGRLALCEEMTTQWLEWRLPPEPERSFGYYAAGRYAWSLSDAEPVAPPIPARGALGLWVWYHKETQREE